MEQLQAKRVEGGVQPHPEHAGNHPPSYWNHPLDTLHPYLDPAAIYLFVTP